MQEAILHFSLVFFGSSLASEVVHWLPAEEGMHFKPTQHAVELFWQSHPTCFVSKTALIPVRAELQVRVDALVPHAAGEGHGLPPGIGSGRGLHGGVVGLRVPWLTG